jgi:hypothetical protein
MITLPERGKGSRGVVSVGRSLVDFAVMAASRGTPAVGAKAKAPPFARSLRCSS